MIKCTHAEQVDLIQNKNVFMQSITMLSTGNSLAQQQQKSLQCYAERKFTINDSWVQCFKTKYFIRFTCYFWSAAKIYS